MEKNPLFDDILPEFAVGIEVPYDLRFINMVTDWLSGLAALAGGTSKEINGLCLALDETLTFLIHSYPDAEAWERIRIEFLLLMGGVLQIIATNTGPPVHLERIPMYNPQAPSESDIDGLWYFLAREAVDDLTFENLGMEGWRAIIKTRLASAAFEKKAPLEAADSQPAGKMTFSTRIAVPEDAAGLVDLTYDTYRYSYPVEEFYNESLLRRTLEEGKIISVVVEAEGVIVGNSSSRVLQKRPRCAYLGAFMIRRAFRYSRAILHLINAIDRHINSAFLPVDLYYATIVTTHSSSQKVGAKLGFMPLALLLAVGAARDYRGMKISDGDRESFLIYVRFAAPPKLPVAYLPERHHAVMAGLLTQVGFDSILSAEEATPVAESSEFSVEEDVNEGSAYIMATQLGRDWGKQLRKKIFSLKAGGLHTVIILIPAWHPTPPGLDHEMGSLNTIFTGFKPVSSQECYLVYSSLSGTVDFERICIADPLAQKLKEHVRRLYTEMMVE